MPFVPYNPAVSRSAIARIIGDTLHNLDKRTVILGGLWQALLEQLGPGPAVSALQFFGLSTDATICRGVKSLSFQAEVALARTTRKMEEP